MGLKEVMFRGKMKALLSDDRIGEIESEGRAHLLLKSYGWTRFKELDGKNVKITITVEGDD